MFAAARLDLVSHHQLVSRETHMKHLALFALLLTAAPLAAQQATGGRGGGQRPERTPIVMDTARARMLYVSKDPKDLPTCNCERDIAAKRRVDSIYEARSKGVMEFRKVTYKSRVDGMEIPAYLFAPLQKRGARG